ncbi:hypothetical protein BT69DRAFT_1083334 [Atractiella rhizophila]|nr:hypothetical protein BT69DRAFT_1083334 [Atractiella rhizophila]
MPTWDKRYSKLFRICEGTTEADPTHVHTCNVYLRHQDLNAPPVHAFTENIRYWGFKSGGSFQDGSYQGGSSGKTSGSAYRTPAVKLADLLEMRNLKCTIVDPIDVPAKGEPNPNNIRKKIQIMVGDVGWRFSSFQYAIACNYDPSGRLTSNRCGLYVDGGSAAVAKPHKKSINEIFRKNFGATCEWVERQGLPTSPGLNVSSSGLESS